AGSATVAARGVSVQQLRRAVERGEQQQHMVMAAAGCGDCCRVDCKHHNNTNNTNRTPLAHLSHSPSPYTRDTP
ncbi:hypothetical protein Pcinc_039004, partial [Petrolisthes cinctipes]